MMKVMDDDYTSKEKESAMKAQRAWEDMEKTIQDLQREKDLTLSEESQKSQEVETRNKAMYMKLLRQLKCAQEKMIALDKQIKLRGKPFAQPTQAQESPSPVMKP